MGEALTLTVWCATLRLTMNALHYALSPQHRFRGLHSLQINPALFHLPTYYVIWNIGSIISGGIFYAVRLPYQQHPTELAASFAGSTE